MTQILLDDVFQKIRYINFYPISLKWRGNPALEVGDWVTMTDRETNYIESSKNQPNQKIFYNR